MIEAGKLKNYFTIQNPTNSQSLTGAVTSTFSTVGYCWGSLDNPSSRQQNLLRSQNVIASHVIALRTNALVDKNSQLVLGSRRFVINHFVKDTYDTTLYVSEVLG